MEKIIRYTVTEADQGLTLRQILKDRCFLSAGQIRHVLNLKGALVFQASPARKTAEPLFTMKTPVLSGDEITITLPDTGPSVVPAEGDLSILYHSNDLLMVNKPSGMAVHPAHGHYDDTLVNYLAALYPEPVRLIGRLDKETSGLIAVTRNTPAATILEKQRADGTLSRIYLALVLGEMEGAGLIDQPLLETRENTPLGENGRPLRLMKPDPSGKPARTEYQVLKVLDVSGEKISLVKIHLLTGRTHQIRTHFAHLGHPLLGDQLYQEYTGTISSMPAPRTMLHSWKIRCLEPFTKEPLEITAPPPEDFMAFLPSDVQVDLDQ
ncbi:MAG: RluA family pseudouridine synthase [Firmicutes bacterium]|nr:RluA family pseudouridine synthase [Bacillota bacterium]